MLLLVCLIYQVAQGIALSLTLSGAASVAGSSGISEGEKEAVLQCVNSVSGHDKCTELGWAEAPKLKLGPRLEQEQELELELGHSLQPVSALRCLVTQTLDLAPSLALLLSTLHYLTYTHTHTHIHIKQLFTEREVVVALIEDQELKGMVRREEERNCTQFVSFTLAAYTTDKAFLAYQRHIVSLFQFTSIWGRFESKSIISFQVAHSILSLYHSMARLCLLIQR
jgi:hypothetical protein